MSTANEILQLARTQLGTTESPAGSNKCIYNTEYYGFEATGSEYPWCVVFIWWVFKHANASDLFYGGKKTASSTELRRYYIERGQTLDNYYDALPGDIAFFNFEGTASIVEHVGIVVRVEGSTIYTIDGNTSPTSDANGGAVMERSRSISTLGGIARPNYVKEEPEMTESEVRLLVEKILMEKANEQAEQNKIVSDWATEVWNDAVSDGVLDGTNPGAFMSREQFAMIYCRNIKNLK